MHADGGSGKDHLCFSCVSACRQESAVGELFPTPTARNQVAAAQRPESLAETNPKRLQQHNNIRDMGQRKGVLDAVDKFVFLRLLRLLSGLLCATDSK